ncbi:selenocysteine-specific translation elongation factor [Anaerobacillus sp. MEB173]|uniref:selenocysteine-specific translation elongation factor n=1 Tax=Anaerobacillus sp. MEB173 TaxID=3383345 RepID=UPI003F8F7AB6
MKEKKYFTIGMAGHIDHGKTSLTKALTNVDTDRLKEEKERSISIELGYAPFKISDDAEVSIIDVPGHERFIRQMIAGVAGIDLVLLVVAADEGVMPQTKEHLDILTLLGIERGMIVVTKVDRVDEDFIKLVQEDIEEQVKGTFFEGAPLVFVDSLSGKGIDELKEMITKQLEEIPGRDAKGAFRLPIDQVFTVHGQGTVVRGTVYEGVVKEGDTLEILPKGDKVRARQLQVHREPRKIGQAGQRVAINLGGISKEDIKRGDVLVSTRHYTSTQTIDVALESVKDLDFPVKQRSLVKLHIGTAEEFGKIVFFDRNELKENESVLCQIRLDNPIVTKRGDRFIVRRPTPVETIGGGTVIDAMGERYRFGEETISMLTRKKEGTPKDRVIDGLKEHKQLSIEQLAKEIVLPVDTVQEIMTELSENDLLIEPVKGQFMLKEVYEDLVEFIINDLKEYHEEYPLRQGKNKAELIQSFTTAVPKKVMEFIIDYAVNQGRLIRQEQFIAIEDFEPYYPEKWSKRMTQVEGALKQQGLTVQPWETNVASAQIPQPLSEELKHYLLRKEIGYALDEKHMIHKEVLLEHLEKLTQQTNELFTLQEAKEVLQLSRKYLVTFLELLDKLTLTEREDGNRRWKSSVVESYLSRSGN